MLLITYGILKPGFLNTVDAVSQGNDYLDGKDGNDYQEGGAKGDTLYGGSGDDNMWGDTTATNVDTPAAHAGYWSNDYRCRSSEAIGVKNATKSIACCARSMRATARFCLQALK